MVHMYPFIHVGVTFDTGGISIKPSSGMGLMRGDMGGAACVVSSLLALAELEYGGSVVALVPLCENMPSGNAVKPGDVVVAKNGKSIEVGAYATSPDVAIIIIMTRPSFVQFGLA